MLWCVIDVWYVFVCVYAGCWLWEFFDLGLVVDFSFGLGLKILLVEVLLGFYASVVVRL